MDRNRESCFSNLYFRFSIALFDSAGGRIKLGNKDSNLD